MESARLLNLADIEFVSRRIRQIELLVLLVLLARVAGVLLIAIVVSALILLIVASAASVGVLSLVVAAGVVRALLLVGVSLGLVLLRSLVPLVVVVLLLVVVGINTTVVVCHGSVLSSLKFAEMQGRLLFPTTEYSQDEKGLNEAGVSYLRIGTRCLRSLGDLSLCLRIIRSLMKAKYCRARQNSP